MKMIIALVMTLIMAATVLANDTTIFYEDFEDGFDQWECHPHWDLDENSYDGNYSASADRNAVLINQMNLENNTNCTLSFSWLRGDNHVRIGLYNQSLEEYTWVAYPENNTNWSSLDLFFDNPEVVYFNSSLKIQTQYSNYPFDHFYIDTINISCLPEPEPSESHDSEIPEPLQTSGRYMPSSSYVSPGVVYGKDSGADVAYTFSTLPVSQRELFAMQIPYDTFVSYCSNGHYEYCAYNRTEEPTESGENNIIQYFMVLGGIYILLGVIEKKW